jgi:hypothetical protein
MTQTVDQFTALCNRLEAAATALREQGCLLQAVARRYYLIYTVATRAAELCNVTIAHRTYVGTIVRSSQFSHRVMPDVVRTLYTGNTSGSIGSGSHSGIVGARLGDREAVRYANWLYQDRILADYGPTATAELFDPRQADERLQWANLLVHDLRTLL